MKNVKKKKRSWQISYKNTTRLFYFDDILFEVIAVPTASTIEVTMGSTAGSSAGPSGTLTLDFYYVIGPLIQTYGYGWGTNTWSGQTLPDQKTAHV